MDRIRAKFAWLARQVGQPVPSGVDPPEEYNKFGKFGKFGRFDNLGKLYSDQKPSIHETLDVMEYFAGPADPKTYSQMMFAFNLLVAYDEVHSKLLAKYMLEEGWCFDDNATKAVQKMRTKVRIGLEDDLFWFKKIAHQLCATIDQPKEQTIAGFANHCVRKCKLPLKQVSRVSLDRVINAFRRVCQENPKRSKRFGQFVQQTKHQNKTQIQINNQHSCVTRIGLAADQDMKRHKVFDSSKTLRQFVSNVAQKCFGGRRL